MADILFDMFEGVNQILNAKLINITVEINPIFNIYLVVNPYMTVGKLKEMIYKQVYYRVPEEYKLKLILVNHHLELTDNTKFLKEYGIGDGSLIKLEIVNLNLKLNLRYKDEVYSLNVVDNPTITGFKTLIKHYIETTEFNPSQHLNELVGKDFELYYKNIRLINKNNINYYNIIDNETIDIIDVCDDSLINVSIRTLANKTLNIRVKENELISNVKMIVADRMDMACIDSFNLLFIGKSLKYTSNETLQTYHIVNNSTLYLVLSLRGGKPVILFYPPKDSEELEVKTILDLHPDCSYTSLLPKPEKEGNKIVWNGIIQNKPDSSDIIVNGRKHKYLFYEFENETSEYISSLIGLQSISDHFNQSYLINDMEEYEDWCYNVLSKIGLKEKDIDDFMTFWADNVYKNGPYVIARIVPETDLSKCCSLDIETTDVKTNIRRVYVSMIICKKLPEWIKTSEMIDWKKEVVVPDYFKPIEYPEDQLTVIEWGGMLSMF